MRDGILSRINFCIFISHPVRCKLRLHYARLYAGGIVDLQSKFVLIPQLELTRALAQTVPDLFLTLLLFAVSTSIGNPLNDGTV